MLNIKSHIRFTQKQRIGIFLLVSLILSIEVVIRIGFNNNNRLEGSAETPQELLALQRQIDSTNVGKQYYDYKKTKKSLPLNNFNPNNLSENDWVNLGFSVKQAKVILKYKQSLGGHFSSKQEIKQCFVINEQKYNQLEPYILLPNTSITIVEKTSPKKEFKKQKSIQYKPFNPNKYTITDWESIGFTTKQAQTIVKYKMSLGGNFTSLNQIQKCYVISEEKFTEMKPYINIKSESNIQQVESQSKENEKKQVKEKPIIKPFNPSTITKEEWLALGFTEKQIRTIFNYKKSLGGRFKDAQTLKKCYSISDEKFKEIEPYLIFED